MEKPHATLRGEETITAVWVLVVSSPVTGASDWSDEGRCNACQAAVGLGLPTAGVSGVCACTLACVCGRGQPASHLRVYALRCHYALHQVQIENFPQVPGRPFPHPNILAHFLSLWLLPEQYGHLRNNQAFWLRGSKSTYKLRAWGLMWT